MKRCILMILLVIFAFSSSVYAQKTGEKAPVGAGKIQENNTKSTSNTPLATQKTPKNDTINSVLDGLKIYYQKLGAFHVDFNQEYHSRLTKRIKKSEGTVDFDKPSKMRWDYIKPDKSSFVTDSKTLWLIDWEEKKLKVHKQFDSGAIEKSLAFLWGGGDLVGSYDISEVKTDKIETKIEKKSRVGLMLLPKEKAQFDVLYLLINPKTYRIEETVLVDAVGNLNHLIFGDPEGDRKFDKAHFDFTKPPKGFSVETAGF